MKFNWEQSGMPASFVNQAKIRSVFSEFKSVIKDAQNQVLSPVDAEAMAKELVESGGREYVDLVRDLSTSLASAKKELDTSNRRYEQLLADLERRGISITDECPKGEESLETSAASTPTPEPVDEWEEWNRKFQSLLG